MKEILPDQCEPPRRRSITAGAFYANPIERAGGSPGVVESRWTGQPLFDRRTEIIGHDERVWNRELPLALEPAG